MSQRTETAVIGAGPAGLSASADEILEIAIANGVRPDPERTPASTRRPPPDERGRRAKTR